MRCDKCSSHIPDNFTYCAGCKEQFEQVRENYQQTNASAIKSNSRKKKLIILASACVVIALCVAVLLRPDAPPPPNFAGDATTVSAGEFHTVGLRADSTVVTTLEWQQEEVSHWRDIVAVSAGQFHTFGLRSNGTVVTTSSDSRHQVVDEWQDIVAISAFGQVLVTGLRVDGTVVSNIGWLQEEMSNWRDIMAVSTGSGHITGLRTDGTVVAAGSFDSHDVNLPEFGLAEWQGIVAVTSGSGFVVGLRSDGTVVTTGRARVLPDLSDWSDIVAISAGRSHLVGLREDGTVVAATRRRNFLQALEVDDWRDIVAVSAGDVHTVGLRADGTVIAAGFGKRAADVADWRDIQLQLPYTGPPFQPIEPEEPPEAPPEEPIPELSPEEIRDLLENIPHPGMNLHALDWPERPGANSQTAIELSDFIHAMNGWWLPTLAASFSSPDEADADFLFRRAFSATNSLQWNNPDRADSYRPELRVLTPYVYPSWIDITLHHHIEQTARQLFGMELEISPQAAPQHMFETFDLFGIYAYHQWGWGSPAIRVPVILSYEYFGGGYEAACVLLWLFWDEELRYFIEHPNAPGIDWETGMTRDEMLEYLQTTTRRHTITLKNNPSGGFYYWAHILPDS